MSIVIACPRFSKRLHAAQLAARKKDLSNRSSQWCFFGLSENGVKSTNHTWWFLWVSYDNPKDINGD
jgi:hypothetical protein